VQCRRAVQADRNWLANDLFEDPDFRTLLSTALCALIVVALDRTFELWINEGLKRLEGSLLLRPIE